MTKYIVISGIDGSGKTSIINSLQKNLEQGGKHSQYFWMRYNHYFVKPLHAIARIIGLSKKYKSEEGYVWRHEFYKSKIFCWLYVRFTFLDTLIGKLKLALLTRKSNTYIICDRWVNDVLIDLGTKTHNSDFLDTPWFHRFQSLLPKNSFQFVIYRETARILECRLENREDPDFEFRNTLYNRVLNKSNIHKIENNSTIENAVEKILSVIQ